MNENYKTYLGKRGYIIIKKNFNETILNDIRKELTVTPFINDAYISQIESFKVYAENNEKLYLPKFYGIEKFGKPDIEKVPKGISIECEFVGNLRENQIEPVTYCINSFNSIGGGILVLPCGEGKTSIALYLGIKLKRKMLIIVHKEFLLNQWKERINQFIPSAKIGILQQDKIEIDNKDIVIGLLQSISMKEYPLNTFDSFGTVIIDECFKGDTKIMTNNGLIKISHLYILFYEKLYDGIPLIYSYNSNKKIFEYKKCTFVWQKKFKGELIKLNFSDNLSIECTFDHKFLTINGYKSAISLQQNDIMICNNKVYQLISTMEYYCECFVYDIEVIDNHNFLISNDEINGGITVHNCHHIGSQIFSKALRKINCPYMLGLSATPQRKDGLTKVFKWYIGDIIYSRKANSENNVLVERLLINSNNEYYNKNESNYKGQPKIPTMINNISENLNRTKLIVYWIKELHKEDRKILVLSDRRKHLEDLNELLLKSGVESVGFYVGGMKEKALKISEDKDIILGTGAIACIDVNEKIIDYITGIEYKLKELNKININVNSFNENKKEFNIVKSGKFGLSNKKTCYTIYHELGQIITSFDHKFYTNNGWKMAINLTKDDYLISSRKINSENINENENDNINNEYYNKGISFGKLGISLPEECMIMSRVKTLYLLKGLFSNNGEINEINIKFKFKNKRFANQTKFLLLKMEFICDIEKYYDNNLIYYNCILKNNYELFFEYFNIKTINKYNVPNYYNRIPLSITKELYDYIEKFNLKDQFYKFIKQNNISYSKIISAEYFTYDLYNKICMHINIKNKYKNILFVKILDIKINNESNDLCDINIPENHNFMISNIIVHNSEGLDIPGLDTLVLTTPKSDIIQSVGRILRKKHEFILPKIIDIVDQFNDVFKLQAEKRKKLYKSRGWIIDNIELWDELNNGEPNIISKKRLEYKHNKEIIETHKNKEEKVIINKNICMF